jgi:hypothetical protein
MLGLGYFLLLCMCGSSPDPAARHSILACVLTLILGTIGLFFGATMMSGPPPPGMPRELVEMTLGSGAFAVYFAAFVFLMRFHASVGRVLGDVALQRHAYVFLLAPFVVVGANWFLVERPFLGPRAFGAAVSLIPWAHVVVNFSLFIWYAIILLQTFRTIDCGLARPVKCDDDDRTDRELGFDGGVPER